MNDYEIINIRDTFSRLFVLAVMNKMNFYSFTTMLEKSDFVKKIEMDKYDDSFSYPLEKIFYSITGFKTVDNSYGIYNDAYWCGQNYFDLHIKLEKSFSYLFLKIPLKKMMDIYLIYHEMDFSALTEYFLNIEKKETIIESLLKAKKSTLQKMSNDTTININTLKKYKESDDCLLNGSFQNIYKIANYYDVPINMFVK